MFKLSQSELFWATARAEYQADDGKRAVAQFRIRCKRMTMPQIKELADRVVAMGQDDASFLREVIVDWDGVTDDDGAPLPYSDAALQSLCDIGMTQAMLSAFYEAQPKARVKN